MFSCGENSLAFRTDERADGRPALEGRFGENSLEVRWCIDDALEELRVGERPEVEARDLRAPDGSLVDVGAGVLRAPLAVGPVVFISSRISR